MSVLRVQSFLTTVGLLLGLGVLPSTNSFQTTTNVAGNRLYSQSGVLAQQDLNRCWSLDIVLLIDQSWSMFATQDPHTGETLVPSDPANYRYQAAKDLLDRLILNRRQECPDAVHRLGILSFGDTAKPVLSSAPSLVQIDLQSTDDPNIWAQDYKRRIDAAVNDKSQNDTEQLVAYQAAQDMFSSAPAIADPPGYGPRHQVVVMLTDGNPTNVGPLPDYMCKMANYLAGGAWSSRSLWVITLSLGQPYLDQGGCSNKTMRQNWQDITRSHRGQLFDLPYNEQTIPAALRVIVQAELGQPGKTIRCGEIFYVDPYLQEVTFAFYHGTAANAPVTLTKVDQSETKIVYQIVQGKENRLDPEQVAGMTVGNYQPPANSIKEEYTFELPRPGAWRFDVQGLASVECQRRFEAQQIPIAADAKMLQPSGFLAQTIAPPFYDEHQPVPLIIQLQAAGLPGTLVKSEPNYDLAVTALISAPEGTQLPSGFALAQPIKLWPAGTGQWSSAGNSALPVYIPAPVAGTYTITVAGTTTFGDGRTPGNLVFTRSFTYDVRKLIHLSFAIDNPTTSTFEPCNAVQDNSLVGQPVTVTVELRDESNQPISARPNLTSDPATSFKATVEDQSGVPLDSAVLKPAPADKPGLFEGALLTDGAVRGCGSVKLKVDFTGQYDVGHFTMPVQSTEVNFERVRLEGVLAKPTTTLGTEPLHSTFSTACPGGAVRPVHFEFRLTDLSGKTIDPQAVASGPVQDLYAVRLVGPNPAVWESLTPTLVQRADGPALDLTGGLTVTSPGNYYIEISANLQAFKDGYAPGNTQPIHVNFARVDGFLTSPSTCNTAIGGGLFLFLAVLLVAIYAFTGGPGGQLEFVRSGTSSTTLAGPWRLKTWRIFNTIQDQALGGLGIKTIRYSKRKTDGAPRAARITITAPDRTLLFDSVLEPDQPLPFDIESNIIYH